jgi:phosphate transport system protein
MQRHIDQELAELKSQILRMGSVVESQIEGSIKALVDRDVDLASRIIERDVLVNSLDVDIDENCMRLLALQAPAARDLRFVTTAMKISTELERMSDLSENICERVIELNEEPQLKPYIDIPRMANWTMQMVRESLDAFVRPGEKGMCQRRFCRPFDASAFSRIALLYARKSTNDHSGYSPHVHWKISGTYRGSCH